MQYRNDRYGNPISALGFGCMRFTRKGGSFDVAKAEKEVLRAVELGVNYFDTAYLYWASGTGLPEKNRKAPFGRSAFLFTAIRKCS